MKRFMVTLALTLVMLCALCVLNICLANQSLVFELNEEGTGYTVVGWQGSQYLTTLEIPDTYDGLPVIGIASGGVLRNKSISEFVLPANYINIPEDAFAGLSIGSITLPAYTDDALINALSMMDSLSRLRLHEDITAYTLIDNILYSADVTCLCLAPRAAPSTIIFPQTLTTIADRALILATNSEYMLFGANITSVGDDVFCHQVYYPEVIYVLKDSPLVQAATNVRRVVEYTTPDEPQVIFKLNEQGTYTAASYTNLFGDDITIPKSIDGIAVTEVGERAFNGKKSGTVTLPDGIISIGDYAFASSSITSLTLPDGIVSIGNSAFANSSITSLTLPDSVIHIGASAFSYSDNTLEALPPNLVSLGSHAIASCFTADTVLVLPESLTSISPGALYGCKAGEYVLPDNLDYDIEWFKSGSYYDKAGHVIRVSDTHPTFKMRDDMLCSRDGNTLYHVPHIDNTQLYTIPSGITHLATGAFAGYSLKYLSLGDTLVSIGDYCFYNNTMLTEVITGSALEHVGEYAFYGCKELREIEFKSVKTIGSYAFNATDSGRVGLNSVTLPLTVEKISPDAFPSSYYSDFTIYSYGGEALAYAIREYNDYVGLNTLVGNNIIYRPYCFSGKLQYGVVGMNGTSESITIPATFNGNSVTFIEQQAFMNATWLKTVKTQYNLEQVSPAAFYGCTSLTSVTFTNSVVYIGEMAFADCSALTNITIPKNVEYIGTAAFAGCAKLNKINVNADNKIYKSNDGVLLSKDGKVLYIFPAGRSSTSCTYSQVILIGPYALYGAKNLKSASFPNATDIYDYAFADCKSLTSTTFSQSLTNIRSYAFSGCAALSSFTINKGVSLLGECVFLGCTSLREFKLEAGTTNYVLQDGILYNSNASRLLICPPALALTEFNTPANVGSINNYAFAYCSALTRANIGSSVRSIGEGAFMMCENLERVDMSMGVTALGEGAFAFCPKFERISIPASVNTFGESIFLGSPVSLIVHCEYLSEIALYAQALGLTCEYSYCTLADVPSVQHVYLPIGESMRVVLPVNIVSVTGGDAHLTINSSTPGYATAKSAGDATLTYNQDDAYILYVHVYEGDSAIAIPEGITHIDAETFAGCESIKRVRVPDSVTFIAEDAFAGILPPTIVCSIGSYADEYAEAHGFAVYYTD